MRPVKRFVLVGISLAVCATLTAQTLSPITKTSSITIKSKQFEEVRRQLQKIASSQQGTVADSKTDVTAKGRRHGWFRLYIPASNIEVTLAEIRKIGTLVGEKSTVQNRQSELDELTLRRGSLNAHVDRLKGTLNGKKAMRGSDVLYLQERVYRAEVDGQLLVLAGNKIKNQVDQASLIVTAYEAGEDITIPPSGFAKFTGNLSRGVKDMVIGTADLIVSLIKWLIFLLIAIPIYRKIKPGLTAGLRKLLGS
jgi:hypothetical protein